MLAPLSAIRPATAAKAAALSGVPMTVTWARPARRARLSPVPRSTSTCMPSASAVAMTSSRSRFHSRGAVTSTPRISRPRSTICSMSTTSTPARERLSKIAEVTPGRSCPERVSNRVLGSAAGPEAFIDAEGIPALPVVPGSPGGWAPSGATPGGR